jgi:dipeptidyl aminopeptidase/acylaminoacyl peptidase
MERNSLAFPAAFALTIAAGLLGSRHGVEGSMRALASTQQAASPAANPPDTDIFLAPLETADGKLTVGSASNITKSPGYDNQPAFLPDGGAVLFTSIRGGKQTDIYRYDIASKGTTRVTNTPESEYSPTITPDRQHISVVRVEADETQRLWRFTLDGKDPELVLANIKPVGYHTWLDSHTVALYVLGQPSTLQIADTDPGTAEIVARDIGRSLQRIPGAGAVSFVQRDAPSESGGSPVFWIRAFDLRIRQITELVRALPGAEPDVAWTPDGTLLTAHEKVLYGWRLGERTWFKVADLDAVGVHDVTRLAVSPKGDWLALVARP